MATHQVSILGGQLKPDTTGDCFFEPFSIKATNDNFDHLVLIFNDTSTDVGVYGVFVVPQNYSTSPAIIPVWSATATTGNVRWQFNYRAIGGDDTESLDQTTFQETIEANDAAPSAIHERLTPSLSLTAGNLAAGDLVEFYLVREGSDTTNDTMSAAAMLHDLIFQYADA